MSEKKEEKELRKVRRTKSDTYYKKKFTSTKLPSAKQEQKYRDIVELFRQGKSQEQVKELMAEKYGIKGSTVHSLITQTLSWIGKKDAETIEYYKENARCMQQIRLEEVYSRCVESRNYKEAINALKELNKLLGLYQDINVHNTQINNNISDKPTTIQFRFGTGEQLMISTDDGLDENKEITFIENG